ncbi:MAG: diguanylate cyclase [Hyphomicrobiales bacterium]|nr:diguanylate cyclase [Hyphomicrobiales bacterium]
MPQLAATPVLKRLRAHVATLRRVMGSKAGLIGSDYATRDEAWDMLEGLFSPFAHGLTAAAIVLLTWYNWYAHGTLSSVPAAVIVVATFSLRLWFVRRYRARGPDARVSDWVKLVEKSSFIAALGWGSSLSILILTTEGPARYAVFALICAPIQGVTARAYAMPSVVIVHISIVLAMVSITSTGFGIPIAIPFALLYLWYQIGFVLELVALRTRMLKANHDKRALLGQVTRYNADLAIMNERLSTFALTDGLTGVSNRRDFDQKLKRCLIERDETAAVALLLIDVDHFKRFNDTFGHLVGDECLKLVAAAIRDIGRDRDGAARYGGEEFALILPDTDRTEALAIAEQVRCAVETMDCSALAGPGTRLTVSIGVGLAAAGSDISPRELVEAADCALYLAKQNGRNCVGDDLTVGSVTQQRIA